MSDSEVEQLVQSISRSSPASQRDLHKTIASIVSGSTAEDTRAVAEALWSLYNARITRDVPVNEFVPSVVSAVAHSEHDNLRTTSEQETAQLAKTLTELLCIRSLTMAVKARDLQFEQDNLFCGARILTDMRPVFDDVKEAPMGFVLFHVLKLEYHHHGQHTEIRVALDNDDLKVLTSVLKRAQDKAMSLSGLSKERQLPVLAE